MDRHNLWISTDIYKRRLFLKNEIKKVLLKSILLNNNTTYARRYLARYYLSLLPRMSSRNFSNNRCVFSGRSWGVNSKTQMSRFIHRNKVYQSEIPGCSKASW